MAAYYSINSIDLLFLLWPSLLYGNNIGLVVKSVDMHAIPTRTRLVSVLYKNA